MLKAVKGIGLFFLFEIIAILFGGILFQESTPGYTIYAVLSFALSIVFGAVIASMTSKKQTTQNAEVNKLQENSQDSVVNKEIPIAKENIKKQETYALDNSKSKWKTLLLIGEKPNLDLRDCLELTVITAMEEKIDRLYKRFIANAGSAQEGEQILHSFKECCLSSDLPLAAEIRLDSLINEYEKKFSYGSTLYAIDHMEGHEFEIWCAALLKRNGFVNVEVTPGSKDHGVDILAIKDGVHYAIQCKCYSSDLGNKPIQEVYAGKEMYRCQVGAVMTNQHFTAGAKALAESTRVLLWDRDTLIGMMDSFNQN